MKKVIVTKLSRAIRHVVSRGAQGPRGGLWGDWSEIPGKPDFDSLYDPHGAASDAQSAAAEDATAKVNAHASAPDPHPQYATDADLSVHTGNTSNPHSVTKAQLGLGNVDNTSDASKPVSTAQQNALNGKEPTITAGTSAQFWRGDKTWADFAANVRMSGLTGLSTALSVVVTAADTVLGAIGKLQAQISDVVTQADAEAGTATAVKAWTSLRVRQAVAAWWAGITAIDGKAIGNTTRSTGKFTTLEASGNSVLGSGSSSFVTLTGSLLLNDARPSGNAINISKTYSPTAGAVNIGSAVTLTSTVTTTASTYDVASSQAVRPVIQAGVSNTGYIHTTQFAALRNGISSAQPDSGTLAQLYGARYQLGHYNLDAAATPITNTIIGTLITPFAYTGSIGTFYGVSVGAIIGTAPNVALASAFHSSMSDNTGHLGLNIEGSVRNYLAGNTGIGEQPTSGAKLSVAGPVRIGQYTLSTLPSAAAFSGGLIDVTNATGGPKTCRSNGTDWCLINTTTPVS